MLESRHSFEYKTCPVPPYVGVHEPWMAWDGWSSGSDGWFHPPVWGLPLRFFASENVTLYPLQHCHPWLSWGLSPNFWRCWDQHHYFVPYLHWGDKCILDKLYNVLVYKPLISSILHPWLQLQYSHPFLGVLLRNLPLQYSPQTIISFHFFYSPIFFSYFILETKFLVMFTFSWPHLPPDIFSSSFQLMPFEYLNYTTSKSAGTLAPSTVSI